MPCQRTTCFVVFSVFTRVCVVELSLSFFYHFRVRNRCFGLGSEGTKTEIDPGLSALAFCLYSASDLDPNLHHTYRTNDPQSILKFLLWSQLWVSTKVVFVLCQGNKIVLIFFILFIISVYFQAGRKSVVKLLRSY